MSYSLSYSDVSDERIINDYWHFICISWDGVNGNVNFFYEGPKQTKIFGPITQLSPRGNFSIGVQKDSSSGSYSSSFDGTLSGVNIWSYVLSPESIVSMSSGIVNINGDLLAWRDMQSYLVGSLSVISNSNIYFPGKKCFCMISFTTTLAFVFSKINLF